jgi:hypothetical protein
VAKTLSNNNFSLSLYETFSRKKSNAFCTSFASPMTLCREFAEKID